MKLPALLALMVLAHTAFTGGRVALSLSAIGAGGTPFQVGLVVSLLAVVPMFLSVHAGRWSDRQGLARPVLLALLMLAAGLLLATRPALATLGGAAVLLGCGFMLIHVAVNNAVGQGDAAAAHARGYSMLALGVSVSTIAGPMLAGVLVDLAGYARAFLALAVLPLLAMPVLLLVRRTGLAAPVPIAPAAKARVVDLLRHPPLRAVFVVSALLSMGRDLFGFMLPVHGERIGLSASMIGAIMGAFGAGTFVVRLFVGTLGRRFTEWQLLGGALALSAAVYVAMPLLRAMPVLLALAFVLGLGLGCAMPLTMSAIARSAPAGRSGEAIGIPEKWAHFILERNARFREVIEEGVRFFERELQRQKRLAERRKRPVILDLASRPKAGEKLIKRFALVEQAEEMDCGAACLAMLCRHYGINITLGKLRELANVTTQGATLDSLARAGEALGFGARGVQCTFDALLGFELPFIVHWEGYHYVIVYGVAPDKAWVADPAVGFRRMSVEEFERGWSGTCLVFTPGQQLARLEAARSPWLRFVGFLSRRARQSGALRTARLIPLNDVATRKPRLVMFFVPEQHRLCLIVSFWRLPCTSESCCPPTDRRPPGAPSCTASRLPAASAPRRSP